MCSNNCDNYSCVHGSEYNQYCNYFNKKSIDIELDANRDCEGFIRACNCSNCKNAIEKYYEYDDIDYYCKFQNQKERIMSVCDILYNWQGENKKQCPIIDKYEED